MNLVRVHNRFVADCVQFDQRIEELRVERNAMAPWRAQYLTESFLSQLWQLWGRFCRDIILASCSGCTTATGKVTARPADNSWQRIGYEARQAAFRQTVHASRRNSSMRQEPTWGDVNKLIDIITTLAPSNSATLLSAFGLPLRGPKDLQIVRNACSHLHSENISDVRGIQIYYIAGPIKHPSELAWRPEASTGTTAMLKWIDDFQVIAGIACQ